LSTGPASRIDAITCICTRLRPFGTRNVPRSHGSIAYTYDGADNLTQKGSVQQAFNNADELCWTSPTPSSCSTPPTGATTYQYDNRGNRTNVTPSGGQALTLTYDQMSRLTKYAAASTTSYGYDADGLRMCKVLGSFTQPCQATGSTQFAWDVAGPLPFLLDDGSTAYIYGPNGLPLEQVTASSTLWFHHDQVGSTRLVTDSTGVSQATYTFDAFGTVVATTGSITNPLRFAGQYQDAESGFTTCGHATTIRQQPNSSAATRWFHLRSSPTDMR